MEWLIRCEELLERLGEDEVLVLDCREDGSPDPYGHLQIPGVFALALSELEAAMEVLPEDELIVLCGGNLDGSDAYQAWAILTGSGRTAVCLEGGLHSWVTLGYPTEPRAKGTSSGAHSQAPE